MENLGIVSASRVLITTFCSHQPTGPGCIWDESKVTLQSLCIEGRGKKDWLKERTEKKET